ncbi:hypothetical protein SCOCK_260005 [Actinacidiphila cocklensis]|uniref:Uncharacterized protein n=1 Tax=Actinacidiphila cocklensis TaxID=887465 RepID=A0A9W4E726_9ACTN|nr:hypothetical protein SCOCK_260005 [Actinacidiphila cocklensis]
MTHRNAAGERNSASNTPRCMTQPFRSPSQNGHKSSAKYPTMVPGNTAGQAVAHGSAPTGMR